nr:MAG TPA: hypothetical protein [Caudoviricetes sp.]
MHPVPEHYYKGRCKRTFSIPDIWKGSPGRGTKI